VHHARGRGGDASTNFSHGSCDDHQKRRPRQAALAVVRETDQF
jgi:hypothetical protein